MVIVLDKSKQIPLECYGKKKLGHNSGIFRFRTNFREANPPKMGKIIGVSEINLYYKIDF